jgi:hypothetical protein
MKKFLFSALFLLNYFFLFAQKGFYVGANAGYGFSVGGRDYYDVSSSIRTYKNESAGAGICPSLQAGYFFTNNLGFELGAGYLLGSPVSIENNVGNYFFEGDRNYSKNDISDKFQTFYLNPSIIFKTNLLKFSPYMKMS